MMATTIVIFRTFREGIVFALFPELPADNYGVFCTCYEHVGQHGSADYRLCMANSHPAAPEQYATLFNELERRGYHLQVHHRATPIMHERRRWLATLVKCRPSA
jgi:hypothetical protein